MMRILHEDTILEMSKLTADYADESLCGDFGEFIYFSPSLDAHGPRVKFYGGTKETSTIRNAPSLAFTNNGETTIEIAQWMNKKNCPNAFDMKYVAKINNFIQRTLPVLLLVWYYKLDESHALKFFEGGITLKNMLSHVENIESGLDDIKNAKSISDLHKICTENNVYRFGGTL